MPTKLPPFSGFSDLPAALDWIEQAQKTGGVVGGNSVRPSQKCINLTRPSQFFQMFYFLKTYMCTYHFFTHKINFLENLSTYYFVPIAKGRKNTKTVAYQRW